MNKIYKYNRYLYKAVQIIIGMDVIYRCRDNNIKALICFVLFLVIVINDYLRAKYFYKTVKEYYSSISLAMIINLILSFHIEGYIDIYFYLILYELILYGEEKFQDYSYH
jgi:hypothetical protein